MINAGKYNKKISIYQTTVVKDSAGFQSKQRDLALQTYAHVKTTKGMTLIKNNTDFEKAYTNFTILVMVCQLLYKSVKINNHSIGQLYFSLLVFT